MSRKDMDMFEDPFDSPIASPTPFSNYPLLNNVPANAAMDIFNDPEAWEVPEDAGANPLDFYMSLDQREMEEEMAWLDREVRLSMPFTPSILGITGSSLSDEDTILPSPFSPREVEVLEHIYDLMNPKRSLQDRDQANSKPEPMAILPPYVQNPPGGLDSTRHCRQHLIQGLTESEGDDSIDFFTSGSGSQNNFSAELHTQLARALSGSKGSALTDSPLGLSPDNSPVSSGYSSSSSSSCGCCSSSRSNSIGSVSPTLGPSKPHEAVATSSSHSIKSMRILAHVPSSATNRGIQEPSQSSSLPRPVAITTDASDDVAERCEVLQNILKTAHQGNTTSIESVGADVQPLVTFASKFNFPEKTKRRRAIICDCPPKRRLKSPLLLTRVSPKPAPTIPLPELPQDDPPPVPPKDAPSPLKSDVNTSKVTIRRLPIPPTKTATPNRELKRNASHCSQRPPHVNTRISHRSSASLSAAYPSTLSRAGYSRSASTDSSSFGPLTSGPSPSSRSPPCPAGPRQRTYLTNYHNPTKPATFASMQVKSSISVTGTGFRGKRIVATIARRSISVPNGLPRHGYSKSEC